MRGRGWIAGLAIGVALAALALLVHQANLDTAAATLGLDRLTSLARPPLGQNARVALAAAAVVLGLLFALMLRRSARRDEVDRAEAATEMRHIAPATVRPVAGTPAPTNRDQREEVAQLFASAPQVVIEEKPATEPDHPPGIPHASAIPKPATIAPETIASANIVPEIIAAVPVADAAVPVATAPIETVATNSATHELAAFTARFETIEARMGDMVRQIAELAGLARTAARAPTPTPTASVSHIPPAPVRLRAPDDPARRRAIGAAARALRERLGDAPEPL